MIRTIASVVIICGLAACTAPVGDNPPTITKPTPASVCQAIYNAQSNPTVKGQLDAIDPTSALGVVWAQSKSGCNGPIPIAGVSETWRQAVWHMVVQMLPVVLPKLIPLVVAAI